MKIITSSYFGHIYKLKPKIRALNPLEKMDIEYLSINPIHKGEQGRKTLFSDEA